MVRCSARRSTSIGLALAVIALAPDAFAQVLGACGTRDALKPAATAASPGPAGQAMTISRVPLPGEQAPNFELVAVVGKAIKKIKLSDYDGKWRVVCFYPADFTFV